MGNRTTTLVSKTKTSNHNQLLDKNNIENKTTTLVSEIYIEECSNHTNEVIKYFCPQHEALGCHDCMTMDHRTCKIDYIPHLKCAGIGNSDEYKGTMWLLNQKLKEIDNIVKKATVREKEIDTNHDKLIQDIVKFRQEINFRLDKLQREVEKNAKKEKHDHKQVVQKVHAKCKLISANIKKLQHNRRTNHNSEQNGQLFINLKQAQSILKSDEAERTEEALEETNMQYKFERNKSLEDVLAKQKKFGNVNLVRPKKKPFDHPTYKEDINVATKSDTGCCNITGCAILSPNKLVLADNYNKKLKVVDIQDKAVTEEKKLDSAPCYIAAIPQEQVAVTIPKQRKVIIMKADRNLSTVKEIGIKGACFGITYYQDHLYVFCQKPNSVLVLDRQCNVQYKTSLNNDIFNNPEYIAVSENSRHIYISDFGSHSVVSVTLQGDVSAVYQHKDLYGPRGMSVPDDGSLLVCTYHNGTIHHISRDLKQGQIVTHDLLSPYTICYSHQRDEVYIASWNDQLQVFIMK